MLNTDLYQSMLFFSNPIKYLVTYYNKNVDIIWLFHKLVYYETFV